MQSGGAVSRVISAKDMGLLPRNREDRSPDERDARYKRRAQVLLYQAASLLAEVEGSEQRLAWLLEDCADLLVREEPVGPVA